MSPHFDSDLQDSDTISLHDPLAQSWWCATISSLVTKLVFFFSITATLKVQSARWMWPSSPVPPFCLRVWCVAGLLLATHFVLLPAEAGISAVHVQLSGLQDCSCTLVMVPASFSWTCQKVQKILFRQTFTEILALCCDLDHNLAGHFSGWWCTIKLGLLAKASQLRRYNSPTLITEALIVTLTLRTANPWQSDSWRCTTIPSLVTKNWAVQKILSGQNPDRQTWWSQYNPHPHFFCSEGNNGRGIMNNNQWHWFSGHVLWITLCFSCSVALVQWPCSMNNPVFLLLSGTGSVAMFYE